jgi:hypothetical protein
MQLTYTSDWVLLPKDSMLVVSNKKNEKGERAIDVRVSTIDLVGGACLVVCAAELNAMLCCVSVCWFREVAEAAARALDAAVRSEAAGLFSASVIANCQRCDCRGSRFGSASWQDDALCTSCGQRALFVIGASQI